MLKTNIENLIKNLSDFDVEAQYREIEEDIREKYEIAEVYYKRIDSFRQEIINDGYSTEEDETASKKDLVFNLDEIVNTLRKNYDEFIEEKYLLLDKLFVEDIHQQGQCLKEFARQTNRIVSEMPHLVYEEEFQKMRKIFEVLDAEFSRLQQLQN